MPKYSIRDLDLTNRRVFIRVDFNVPLKNGTITDDTRIRASIPTIRYALEHNASVVLASHLGRPKGKPDPAFSLNPVVKRLSELLSTPVEFATDCVGEAAEQAIARAKAAGTPTVVLLENLRFHAEEEQNDPAFAAQLAALADVYVNDAFGAAHRAHASVAGIVTLVKQAGAGLLLEKELQYLGHVLESPERPFIAVLGGAKVSDKIEVIQNLLSKVDRLLIGGAMAYTFFKAAGWPIGKSLVEDDRLAAANAIREQAKLKNIDLQLPVDHIVVDKINSEARGETLETSDPAIGDRMGVDIGPETIARYAVLLSDARTVVWNGPMGVFEVDPFGRGTMAIARAVAAVHGTTIVGGGDSIAAIRKGGVADRMSHISTGGGASLEFLGGRKLPGVEALPDKP